MRIPYTNVKRVAFYIVIRDRFNGAEIRRVLWLRPEQDAFERAISYLPQAEQHRWRGISCDPATAEQVAAHKARMAAI